MKKRILFLLLVLGASLARAQQVDDDGDVVVNLNGITIWGPGGPGAQMPGTASLECDALAGTGAPLSTSVTHVWGKGGPEVFPQLSTRLVPGASYSVVLRVNNNYTPNPGQGADSIQLHVTAPDGYAVDISSPQSPLSFVGDGPQGEFTFAPTLNAPTSSIYATIRVRSLRREFGLRAGLATSLSSGRTMWQLSLGTLSNGTPAGFLTFDNIAPSGPLANVFTRANLHCDASTSDVQSLSDSSDSTVLRQVIAPQVCVDIVGALTSGSIQLKCYHGSQRSATVDSSGYYTFTGDPYAQYLVQPQSSDDAGVIISCDVRNVSSPTLSGQPALRTLYTQLTRTGTSPNYSWTTTNWYTGATAPVQAVKARSGSTETVSIQDSSGTVAVTSSRTYNNGSATPLLLTDEITGVTVGSPTNNPDGTTYAFYTDTTVPTYGRLKSSLTTGGSWQNFTYYTNGQIQTVQSPYNNSPSSNPSSGVNVTYTWSSDSFGFLTRPGSVVTTVNGITTAQSSTTYTTETPFFAYSTDHPNLNIVKAETTISTNGSSSLTSITKTFAEDVGVFNPYTFGPYTYTDDFLRGQIHSSQRPDGLKQCFIYQRGTWDGTTFTPSGNAGLDYGPASRIVVINGTVASTANTTPCTTYVGSPYPIDALNVVTNKSTLQVTIRDSNADVVRTELQVWNGSNWNLVSWVNATFNLAHQLTARTSSNGSTYSVVYSGEQIASETDETGLTKTYQYDAADRVYSVSRTNGPTTTFVYDAVGHVTQQTDTAGSLSLVTQHAYDDAGRVRSETPAGLGKTSIAYDVVNRTQTTTLPDNNTRVETFQLDGRPLAVSGTAVIPSNVVYSIDSAGMSWTQAYSGSSTSATARWQKTETDWIGRTVHSERPGFAQSGQANYTEDYTFDDTAGTGRLLQATRSGSAPILYQYDELSQVSRTGFDLDNSNLDLAGNNRITEMTRYFEYYSNAWWTREDTRTYPTTGSSSALVVSTVRHRLSGFPTHRLGEQQSIDIEGNMMVRTVDVDPSTATVTTTTTRPDATNPQTEVTVLGVSTTITGFDLQQASTVFDGFGRVSRSTDPRGNTSQVNYYPGTNLVNTVADATKATTTYYYDNMGRRTAVQDPAGNVTNFAYTALGQLLAQYGNGSYPVLYGYDPNFGDRTSLSTYRGATSWSDSSKSFSGTPDTTLWTYDGPSGLLWQKTDAAGKVVSYDYNNRGQTISRTWARHVNNDSTQPLVTTTYAYYGDTVGDLPTGELKSVSYNDGTPGISYSYTRLGQLSTVNDATGTRTFNFDGTQPLRLANETLDTAFYANRVLAYLYDTSTGIGGSASYGSYTPGFLKGRAIGFELGVAGNQGRDLHQNITYSNLGQFAGVNTRVTTGAARDFVYAYDTADILAGYSVPGTSFALNYGYESQRNLRTRVSSTWGSTVFTQFDYVYNSLGQRQSAKQSGSAYADYYTGASYNGVYNYYTYNNRGELQTTSMYAGSTPPAAGSLPNDTELPGRRFEYRFDNIGNRTSAGQTGGSGDDQYSPNSLNQYDWKENNTVPILGTAVAGAKVATYATTTTPSGTAPIGAQVVKTDRSFAAFLVPPNATGPAQGSLTVYAALPGAGSGGADIIGSKANPWFAAPQRQTLSYDADGNLIDDDVWSYTYDAENRLVTMTSVALPTGFTHLALGFQYDYLGRRVAKTVYNLDTAQMTLARRYVYDGWALIAETDTSGNLLRAYTWGLDLAGSLDATGGVGGLLQITNFNRGGSTTNYFPTYDGNGNIAALVRDDGFLAAAYEYSPAGESLRKEIFDPVVADNPFRFSSKFTDDETGLVYYGHRYYSPGLGRFINRDSIEEQGGLNLYGFCGNDGVNHFDVLGNSWLSTFLKFSRKATRDFFNVTTLGTLRSPIYHLYNWGENHQMELEMAAAIVASCFIGPEVAAMVEFELEGALVGTALTASEISTVAAIGGSIAGGAASGFVSGVSLAAMERKPVGQALQAGLKGAEYGAIQGGISAGMAQLNTNLNLKPKSFTWEISSDALTKNAANLGRIVASGLEGAVTNKLENKNASSGFWSGVVSGAGAAFKAPGKVSFFSREYALDGLAQLGISGLGSMNKHGQGFMTGFWSTASSILTSYKWVPDNWAPWEKDLIGVAEKGIAGGAISRFGRKTFRDGLLTGASAETIKDGLTWMEGGDAGSVSSQVNAGYKLVQPKVGKKGVITYPINSISGGNWALGQPWDQI